MGKKICHFLLNVTINEASKTKIMGETGFYGFSPCRGSTVKQFLGRGATSINRSVCPAGWPAGRLAV